MQNLHPNPFVQPYQPQVAQLDNGPAEAPAKRLLMRLRAGEKVEVFDYRKSIHALGELLEKYKSDVCNDNISVLLRDWGYKIAKLDLRNAGKVKSMVCEQLDLLAKKILVNEIDDSPLREPVFLGEVLGELAEFVGEKEMLQEYLQFMHLSTETLKVHLFATDVLAWVKPIAEWAKKSEQNPVQALMPYQGGIANPIDVQPAALVPDNLIDRVTAPQAPLPGFNPWLFPAGFGMPLDPAVEAKLEKTNKMRKITKKLPAGLIIQQWKRRLVEQRNGALVANQAGDEAALQEHLKAILMQFENHQQDMHAALEFLKYLHDEEIEVLNGNHADLLQKLLDTNERLITEEKRSAELGAQVRNLYASLQSAWGRINELANDDGGTCVVQ